MINSIILNNQSENHEYSYIRNNRQTVFIGDILNNVPHGSGIWQNDELNGYFEIYANDGSIYKGQVKNGNYDGCGIGIDTEGKIYDGHWVNNMHNGKGTKYAPNGTIIFKGLWHNNEPLYDIIS